MQRGRLIVFEGPDGTGKTVLSRKLVNHFNLRSERAIYVSFPGNTERTLGALVYKLHHNPTSLGVGTIEPTSMQLLHVAAHIDAIKQLIQPAISSGTSVVLDRYWWSVIAYGRVSGAQLASLDQMVEIEKTHWADLQPEIVFLLSRARPAKAGVETDAHEKLLAEYERIMLSYGGRAQLLLTDGNEDEAFEAVRAALEV